jgi:hypothetical protein
MITRHKLPGRRVLPFLATSATLALAGGFAINAGSAAAQTVGAEQAASENWAGYSVHSHTGQNYSSVSGSWTQPSVNASSGDGSSAFWIGLGGASQQSQALEQVGTAADVVNGQTEYYAWYELVSAAETKLNIPVHPGDHISGKVTVNGSNVTVSLSDQTTGASATKALQMSNPDTASAEWIAEAPSAVTSGGYQVMPLADFGEVTFTNALAMSAGHTGSISDSNWSAQAIQLSSGSGTQLLGRGSFAPTGLSGGDAAQSSAGASPSDVSNDGSSFSVSYSDDGASPTTSSGSGSGDSSGRAGDTGGYPGSGYSGDGSPGGYSDPGYSYGDGGGGYGYDTPGGYVITL